MIGAWRIAVAKEVAARGDSTSVALLRPSQARKGSFAVLATLPMGAARSPRRTGRGSSPATAELSPKRLRAWLSSTCKRFSNELAEDAKVAGDRSLVQEISSEFSSGLAADLERERREAEAREAAKQAAEEERREEVRRAKETERRQELRKSIGQEPAPGPGVVSLAVRLTDGKRLRRRFHEEDPFRRVFEWLDAMAELDLGSFALKKFGAGEEEFGSRLEATDTVFRTPLRDTGLVSSSLLVVEPIG